MPPRCQVRAALALLAALAASRPAAAPVLKQAEGTYSDDFTDTSGLALKQNVKLGNPLSPGVRVALTTWSFAQSYTQASDAVSRPFSDSSAVFSLTTVTPTGEVW